MNKQEKTLSDKGKLCLSVVNGSQEMKYSEKDVKEAIRKLKEEVHEKGVNSGVVYEDIFHKSLNEIFGSRLVEEKS